MSNDIRMLSLSKVKPDRHPSWVSVGIGIRDVRQPSGVAEADPDGCASVVEMRGGGERGGFF